MSRKESRMGRCEGVSRHVADLVGMSLGEIPAEVIQHLAGCPACARAVVAARLTRGLVAAATEGPEPPAGFAEKVLAALPNASQPSVAVEDLWRPAWGLVPAFAAAAVALLLLVQASTAPGPGGLLQTEGLSASERLVLDAPAPNLDMILAAVLERSEP